MDKPIQLAAGQLTALFQPTTGMLREVRYQGVELIHGVYAAVRDQNWDTIEPVLQELVYDLEEDQFVVTFRADCKLEEIDFSWQGRIDGSREGKLTYTLDGIFHSTFRRNRIGFCVLHAASCSGQTCQVEHIDGMVEKSSFPVQIAPHQPFKSLRSIRHEPAPGLSVDVRMMGETFEMEDQRNWTDASFKTYCTPLDDPFPVEVPSGTRIEQSITLNVRMTEERTNVFGQPPKNNPASAHEQIIRIDTSPPAKRFPAIGLGVCPLGETLSTRQQELVEMLALSHLRVDFDFSRGNPLEMLWRTLEVYLTCLSSVWKNKIESDFGQGFEVALMFTNNAESELHAIADGLAKRKFPIARWLVFHHEEKSTGGRWLELAQRILKTTFPNTPIYGGTNYYFAELNRQRPPLDAIEGLCYSINPQVHAFDDRSLIETLSVQSETVRSTQAFAPAKPIAVSPVTLLPRSNPNATSTASVSDADNSPLPADLRQATHFAAAWTLGSLKNLSAGGVSSMTFYELLGKRGVLPEIGAEESPVNVFPLFHVFADVAPFCGAEIVPCQSSDPLAVEAMLLKRPGKQRLMVANLTPSPAQAKIGPLDGTWSVRCLDATTESSALDDPIRFRSTHHDQVSASDQSLRLDLAPYAVVTLDQENLIDA